MKTKEQKFFQFKYELGKAKKWSVWGPIIIILFSVIFFEVTHYINAIGNLGRYCAYGIVLIMMVPFGSMMIRNVNMKKRYDELKKEVDEEKEYVNRIKSEYLTLSSCRFDEIPVNLRETAKKLLSNPKKSPEEIIQDRKEQIEYYEFQLKIYHTSPDQNWWQYFISWKWLKSINV